MTKRDIYGCLDIPDADRETAISEREGQYLYDLVRDHQFSATLEVGLAWGASAAFILAAGAKCHIAIDPFQEKDYGDQGLKNLSKLKLTQRLVHVCDLSARALPRLWAEGRTLDFAFIDGGHRFDDIFIDWYYIDQMLQQNGMVIFDDAWMRSTQIAAGFIEKNRTDYHRIKGHLRNFVVFRKLGSDVRPWYHFEEFCNYHICGRALRMMGRVLLRGSASTSTRTPAASKWRRSSST